MRCSPFNYHVNVYHTAFLVSAFAGRIPYLLMACLQIVKGNCSNELLPWVELSSQGARSWPQMFSQIVCTPRAALVTDHHSVSLAQRSYLSNSILMSLLTSSLSEWSYCCIFDPFQIRSRCCPYWDTRLISCQYYLVEVVLLQPHDCDCLCTSSCWTWAVSLSISPKLIFKSTGFIFQPFSWVSNPIGS